MKKFQHQGWIILIVIVFTVLACLGFGRFSFGAILPFMKDGLGLDYRETGLIASAIFLGYLISVTVIGYFTIYFGAKRVIVVSLFIISLGMVITANSHGFWLAYNGSLLMGIGSGGAYITSLGLVSQWFVPERKGMALGIAMGGSGVGFVFSGYVVPLLVGIDPSSGWRMSWYILAFIVFLIMLLNGIKLKNTPKDVGLFPVGYREGEKKEVSNPVIENKKDKFEVYKNKQIWAIGIIYMAWGFSYLIFSTFLVDYLIADVGLDKELAGTIFAVAGMASIISGFLWGYVSDRFGRMVSLSFVYFIQFIMLLLMSITTNIGFIFLEVIVYGITLWGVPTVMNASVGDFIRQPYVPIAMGFITLFFSIGQLISPIITGFLIEASQNYFSAFLLSASVCLVGCIGCLLLFNYQKSLLKNNVVYKVDC